MINKVIKNHTSCQMFYFLLSVTGLIKNLYFLAMCLKQENKTCGNYKNVKREIRQTQAERKKWKWRIAQ